MASSPTAPGSADRAQASESRETKSVADLVAGLYAAMEKGAMSQVWDGLQPLLSSDQPAPAEIESRITYLRLACHLYGFGETEAACAFNAGIPGAKWAPLRYRLALRRKDYGFAARLRRHPDITDKMRWDFNCTMGLHLIWRYRYKWGFHFYQDRYRAINFTKILPSTLRYQPITPDPMQDPDMVVLEQGVGEILLALMHLKAHPRPPAYIAALPKFEHLIRQALPDAHFVGVNTVPAKLRGKAALCAADLFGRAWAQTGHFTPPVRLAEAVRPDHSGPIYGICWRGGSGQNRREERHIPLQYFLDLLPDGARYLPLQFDLTRAENDLLARDSRCQPATLDVSRDPALTLSLVSGLAGVISVDSANWHFAGACGVPLLALMNETPHWFWGPEARVEWTYATATTLPKRDLNRHNVSEWLAGTDAAYARRPRPAAPAATPANRPLLMVGLPRTGSSMSMECLVNHGLWTGDTLRGTSANPRGFFENNVLKDRFIKTVLVRLNADPNGVTTLPDPDNLPLLPDLREAILQEITRQGYKGNTPWGFKDPKLTLLWPVWARAFPDALWVIPRRAPDAIINSLTRVHFMKKHSTDPHYWRMFCACYEQRITALKSSLPNVFEIDTDALAAGDTTELAGIVQSLGLKFDETKARAAIDTTLFRKTAETGGRSKA